jgi:hypothetical protein
VLFILGRKKQMDKNKAINIAVGCVMASHLETKEKREVIEALRKLEEENE